MNSTDLLKELRKKGCLFVRYGKGDHQVWFSPVTNKRFVVPHPKKQLAIGTLMSIRKAAGLDKMNKEK